MAVPAKGSTQQTTETTQLGADGGGQHPVREALVMDCRQVKEAMFLFFDGEMDDTLRAPFRDHVDGCGDCAQHLDYTGKLLLLVRERCVRRAAPARLRERILVSFPHRQAGGSYGTELR